MFGLLDEQGMKSMNTLRHRSGFNFLPAIITALFLFALTGCGEGSSQASPPVAGPPPAPPVAAAPDFTAVSNRIDQFAINNVAIMVGDHTGTLFRYERGTMSSTKPVFIASASKLLLGATAWLMVEDGRLTAETPVSTLIDFWISDPADPRSRVTFGQLFAFTSGFNGTAEQRGCPGDPDFTLRACVQQIHDGGPESPPDQSFNYGNEHMQIAALAMSGLEAKSVDAIMRERLLGPLGVSAETRYTQGSGDNPTYSGGMRSTGEDYALVLAAILRGDIIADRAGFLADRVAPRPVATVPPAISANSLAWHYGWGFWKECDGVTYVNACDDAPVISSTGAFGFTPWIDFAEGYWAIIITEEPLNQGFDPAQKSIALEQDLQPLIAAALRR
jgi:CubicO group peptidase (beta-lactamase class C family)